MASSDVIRHKVHFQNCCHNRAHKVNIKFAVEIWNHDVGTFHIRFAIYELQDHRVNNIYFKIQFSKSSTYCHHKTILNLSLS